MKTNIIRQTDALLRECVTSASKDVVNQMFNAMRLVELRRRASRSKVMNRRWGRRVTVRATELIGREPAQILARIAKDQVAEMLGER
jgi:hypothetical protein